MKGLINKFFDRHEVAWEIFMIVLAVAYVVIGFLPDYIDFAPESYDFLDGLDWGLTGFLCWSLLSDCSWHLPGRGILKTTGWT